MCQIVKLGVVRNGTTKKGKMGCQYDWVEIHINLQDGELALPHGQGFWLKISH